MSSVGQDCKASAAGTAASLLNLWRRLRRRGAGSLLLETEQHCAANLHGKIAGTLSEVLCLSLVNKANKTGLFAVGDMPKNYSPAELSLPAEK